MTKVVLTTHNSAKVMWNTKENKLYSIPSFSSCIKSFAEYKSNGLTRGNQMKFNGCHSYAFKADLKLIATDIFAGNFGCRAITTVKCSKRKEESSLHF